MLRHVPIWALLALTATFKASCTSADGVFPGLSYLPPRPDNTLLEASGRPSVPSVPDLPPPSPPPVPSSPFPPPPPPPPAPSVSIPFPEDNPGFSTVPGSGVIPFPPSLESLGGTLGAPVDPNPLPPLSVGPSGCNEACTKIYNPLCGTDGVTYNNKCLLDVAACKGLATGLNIEIAFEGTCEESILESVDIRGSSLPAGFESSSSSSLCDRQCTKIFKPVCGTDHNTYSNPCLVETASCEAVNSGAAPISVAYEGQCVVRDTAFFAAVMPNVIAAPLVSESSSAVAPGTFDNIGTTSEIVCPEECTKIFTPVCGTDDLTYNNECILNAAACKSRSAGVEPVLKAFDGPCVAALPRGPVCDHACDKTYLPVCGSDGETYNNICLLNLSDCLNPFTTITKAGDGLCTPKSPPSLSTDSRPSISTIPAQIPIPNHSQATEQEYLPPV